VDIFILLQIISYITYIAYFLILLYILLRTTADEEATWPEESISEVEVACKSFEIAGYREAIYMIADFILILA
jgi:hypothetical protein